MVGVGAVHGLGWTVVSRRRGRPPAPRAAEPGHGRCEVTASSCLYHLL